MDSEKDYSKLSDPETQKSLVIQKLTDRDAPESTDRDVTQSHLGCLYLMKRKEFCHELRYFLPLQKPSILNFWEEPPALAFLYKDLYEEAGGEKKKEGETASEGDSVNPKLHFQAEILTLKMEQNIF